MRHISDKGREISLIAWYCQSSFDSAQHVKWWVVCDSRSKLIDLRVLHVILLKCFIWIISDHAHGNEYILVIIDTFSIWVELFPTKSTIAAETACIWISGNHSYRSRTSLSQWVSDWNRAPMWHWTIFCHGIFKRGECYRRACKSRSFTTSSCITLW